MTYQKNVGYYDPAKYEPLLGCINDDYFINYFPLYSLLYDDHQAQSRVENGIAYWSLTHRFLINFDLWEYVELIDRGFSEKIGTNADGSPKLKRCADKDGIPLPKPVYLNGSGTKLSDGADPILKKFYPYPVRNFAVLE